MHYVGIIKDASLNLKELSENNPLVFNLLFMVYGLHQYVVKLVNQLQYNSHKEIFRTK